jgi:hypothetical protein
VIIPHAAGFPGIQAAKLLFNTLLSGKYSEGRAEWVICPKTWLTLSEKRGVLSILVGAKF